MLWFRDHAPAGFRSTQCWGVLNNDASRHVFNGRGLRSVGDRIAIRSSSGPRVPVVEYDHSVGTVLGDIANQNGQFLIGNSELAVGFKMPELRRGIFT